MVSAYTLYSARPRLVEIEPVSIPLDGTEGDPFRVVRLFETVRRGVVRRIGERQVWRR